MSYFAQISDGQRPKSIINRYAIPKRSVFNSSCTGTHPGVRGLAPKQVGRKGHTMQVPSILQGESLKRLLQGAAVGAVATIFARTEVSCAPVSEASGTLFGEIETMIA